MRSHQFSSPSASSDEELAGAIHVALHDVAAQAAGGRKRALQVDARAGAQIAQVAAAQRFRREVGGKTSGPRVQRGQADAVHRDARALRSYPQSPWGSAPSAARRPARGSRTSTVPNSSMIPVNIQVSFHGEFVGRNGMNGDAVHADGVRAPAPADAAGQRQRLQAAQNLGPVIEEDRDPPCRLRARSS